MWLVGRPILVRERIPVSAPGAGLTDSTLATQGHSWSGAPAGTKTLLAHRALASGESLLGAPRANNEEML